MSRREKQLAETGMIFTNSPCNNVATFILFSYAVHAVHMYFQQLDSISLNIELKCIYK